METGSEACITWEMRGRTSNGCGARWPRGAGLPETMVLLRRFDSVLTNMDVWGPLRPERLASLGSAALPELATLGAVAIGPAP